MTVQSWGNLLPVKHPDEDRQQNDPVHGIQTRHSPPLSLRGGIFDHGGFFRTFPLVCYGFLGPLPGIRSSQSVLIGGARPKD